MPATGAQPPPAPAGGAGTGAPRRPWHRFGALVREFGKFGTVGSVAFTVDLTIFNVLLRSGSETLTAKTISTLLAATL
ncbi:MAG TPA: GtrA family protein, partial [Actinoplanes sp.]